MYKSYIKQSNNLTIQQFFLTITTPYPVSRARREFPAKRYMSGAMSVLVLQLYTTNCVND